MQELFLELVQLSLTGSLFVLAVMLVRIIFRKAPKWLFCLLWGVVALRLICPISIESDFSLVPDRLASGQIISNVGSDYVGEVNIIYENNAGYSNAVEAGRQPIYSDSGYYVVTEKDSYDAPATVEETVYPVLSWIWLVGMVLMLTYTAVSYLALKRKMEEATLLRDNIWQCEQAESPFVLGIIKPRIYLPYQISDSDMDNVIAHELAHIHRKDHWWKPIGFLLLSVHWFNPVMWVAYILLCRDIEAACDEKVIKHMEKDEMRAYSTALLHCSVHRRRIAACPLAFGEVGVKERIKRVMNYKKPAFWIIILAIVVSLVAGVLLLTNPTEKNTTLMGAYYKPSELLYTNKQADHEHGLYSRFCITADYWLYAKQEEDEEWSFAQQMEKYPLTVDELKEYTFYDNGWHQNYRLKEITDAYILRTEDEHFFLVMQTKTGDTLLGFGWEDLGERGQGASDDTCIEYLYKLESEFSNYVFHTNFFSLSLKNAIGETDCFHSYRDEKNPGFMVVGFMADPGEEAAYGYSDMGYAVFQANGTGYRLLNYHVYDNAANENNGILFCSDPAILSLDDELTNAVTYDVILSCNENLDKIQREYYKDDELVLETADTAIGGHKNMSLFCWDEMDGPNLRVKQYYLDTNGNEIDFEEFGQAVDNDYLRALVQDIVNNPECATSSNPFDYINASQRKYNEILTYGEDAVNFYVGQLRTGNNGLSGYIMAVACAEITGIGDKYDGADWATAQEWLSLYDSSEHDIIIPKLIATDFISGQQAKLQSFGYSISKAGEELIACGIALWQAEYNTDETLVLDGKNGQNQILLAPQGFSLHRYKIYLPDGTVYDDGTRTLYDSLSPRVMQTEQGICLIAPFQVGEYFYEIELAWPEKDLAVTYGLKVVMTGKESSYDIAVSKIFERYGEGNPLIAATLVDSFTLANAVSSEKYYVFEVENLTEGTKRVAVSTDGKTMYEISSEDELSILDATVLEIGNGRILVEPLAGSWELNSASKIEVPMKNMDPALEPQVGDVIEIIYSGEIQETYPARINEVLGIRIISERPYITEALTLNEVAELAKQQHTVSFVGMTREAVHGYWGEPDAEVHGFFGDIYHVPDSYESVIFCYDEHEMVESVTVEYRNDSEDWGLTLRLQFESENEFDIVISHSSANQTIEGTISASPEYEIRAVHDGKIISYGSYMRDVLGYDYADTVVGWDTVLYSVEPNGELIIDCNLSTIYGSLPAGEYVIYKPIQLTTSTGQTIIKDYIVEFAIVE